MFCGCMHRSDAEAGDPPFRKKRHTQKFDTNPAVSLVHKPKRQIEGKYEDAPLTVAHFSFSCEDILVVFFAGSFLT